MTTRFRAPEGHPIDVCVGGKDGVRPKRIGKSIVEIGDNHFAYIRFRGLRKEMTIKDRSDYGSMNRATVNYCGSYYDVTEKTGAFEVPGMPGSAVNYDGPSTRVKLFNPDFLNRQF
ncbi:hypothetical protein M1403_01955 [Patescibacteria group bacterium]|nr:hypothetical protein [Patescibacteria group bacterium]